MDDEDDKGMEVCDRVPDELAEDSHVLPNQTPNGNLTPPKNILRVENDEESRQSVWTGTSDSCDLVIDQSSAEPVQTLKLNGDHPPESLKRKADNEIELPSTKLFKVDASAEKEHHHPIENDVENPIMKAEEETEAYNLSQSLDYGKSSLIDHNENKNEPLSDLLTSSSDDDEVGKDQAAGQPPLQKLVLKRDGMNNITITSSPKKLPATAAQEAKECSKVFQNDTNIIITEGENKNIKINENLIESEQTGKFDQNEEVEENLLQEKEDPEEKQNFPNQIKEITDDIKSEESVPPNKESKPSFLELALAKPILIPQPVKQQQTTADKSCHFRTLQNNGSFPKQQLWKPNIRKQQLASEDHQRKNMGSKFMTYRNSNLLPHFESVCNKPNTNINVDKNIKLVITNNNLNKSSSSTNATTNTPLLKEDIKKKVFRCSPCGTYYENWNLFLHMREVHKKYICLYCLGIFPTAEKLVTHLENKHQIRKKFYGNFGEYSQQNSSDRLMYFMCSKCEHVFEKNIYFNVNDDELIAKHNCNDYLEKCLCGSVKAPKHKCVLPSPSSSSLNKVSTLNIHYNNNNKIVNSNSGAVMLYKNNNSNNNNNSNSSNQNRNTNLSSSQQASSKSIFKDRDKYPNAQNPPIIITPDLSHKGSLLSSLLMKNQSFPVPPFPFTAQMPHPPAIPLQSLPLPSSNSAALVPSTIIPKLIINPSQHTSRVCANTDPLPQQPPKVEEQRLLVPKLKVKIPKEYCTPIESEESSTESDYNDDEDDDYNDDFDEDDDMRSVKDEDILTKEPEKVPELVPERMEIVEPDIKPEPLPEPEPKVVQEHKPVQEAMQETEPEPQPPIVEEPAAPPHDGIEVANEDCQLFELTLDEPLDKIPIQEFMKICLKYTYPYCLYCNHARRIAVNGKYLALHFIAMHRFQAIVNSITEEELLPDTIVARLKLSLDDLEKLHFNLETYDSSWSIEEKSVPYPKQFECFQCRFISGIHKELYLHNRKMHQKSILICIMCRANFYNFSELLCHLCPGAANKLIILDYKFRCCLCNVDNISSAFRLMVHLRKRHLACDVCLEDGFDMDQNRLSNHVWKHKLNHLCYRCGIAYRNKDDILKHLYWKHGTESVLCKRCLQKKWPHIYHFCTPPPCFTCEVCNLMFTKSVALKVHKRLHSGEEPYPCTEDNCEKKFISRKLLLKHVARHYEPPPPPKPVTPPYVSPVREKTPIKVEELKPSISIGEDKFPTKTETVQSKKSKKKKKNKDDKESEKNLVDLMDLPALNLSETDSSDESDHHDKASIQIKAFSQMSHNIVENSDDEIEGKEENKATPIASIWENFKSYQAQTKKSEEFKDRDDDYAFILTPILHVTQSDHDYSMMYVKIVEEVKESKDDDIEFVESVPPIEMKIEKDVDLKVKEEAKGASGSSSVKRAKKEGASSSSDSSDSESSCGCESSNCSCSSSSSSGSSSSSDSSDTDEKSPKKSKKKESNLKIKTEEVVIEELVKMEEKIEFAAPVDMDAIMLESDLETEESETDEDFYDEHPQKMASQLLAEKRKQLMLQTCMSPANTYGIIENSRPSTPSLPEEMVAKKKVKVKKKKKERKASKHAIPPLKLNIPPPMRLNEDICPSQMQYPPPIMREITTPSMLLHHPMGHSRPHSISKITTPRLSTGNSSESDAPLKRSQRSRKPNKFYGYTSDEEGSSNTGMLLTPTLKTNAILSVMKPMPPPNLTWSKEDLPSPPSSASKVKTPKLTRAPAAFTKTSNAAMTPELNYPPIPPVIIRPSQITPISYQPPRVVEPLRIPNVPVHHITPEAVAASSDSNSSDEGALHIQQEPIRTPKTAQPPLPKLKLSALSKKFKNSIKNTQRKRVPKAKAPPIPQPIIAPPAIVPPNYTDEQIPRVPPIGSFPSIHSDFFRPNQIRIPAGWRPPREGESVYCYCRCPYDEVSEMIACDGEECSIEWFHFECVGIIMPPKGKWYCPECKVKYMNTITHIDNNEIQEQLLDSN